MNEQHEQLKAITEMRDLMNRSSRFLSLSGLAGVFAGIYALIGAALAWVLLDNFFFAFPFSSGDIRTGEYTVGSLLDELWFFGAVKALFFVACGVLFMSLLTGWFFSRRKAKREGIPFWDQAASRALINLMIPLAAGGFFCIILFLHGIVGLIAPATLIFYGLALLNASKYTLNDIRYLGICEIILGLLASFFAGYGLIFWTIGFGVLHIVYGIVMWNKYER